MLVKIFGGIDIFLGMILVFLFSFNFAGSILVFFAIMMFIKSSFGMLTDFASWIDLFSGLLFIIAIFTHLFLIANVIIGILMIQKGAFSFV